MKAVLNIVAAVLIAAGLVVAVASLLTPGQVIIGIDFKLAATLIVGGLILHALASALTLLERMSHDLRQLRKAGSEEPPWLRQSTAAMASAAYAAPLAVEAVHEDQSDEIEDEFGRDTAEEPTAAEETRLPEAAESQATAHQDEADWPFPEAPIPGLEQERQLDQGAEPAEAKVEDEADVVPEFEAPGAVVEDQSELAIEFEPSEAVIENQAVFEPEPDPTEATVVGLSEFEREADPTEGTVVSEAEAPSLPKPSEDAVQSEPRPAEAAAEDEAQPSEPELFEEAVADNAGVPSRLTPSHDTFSAADLVAEPAESPQVQEQAVEEHAALYVVEERMFRGRQARVLSDGTIEAETAEGWMRFEDFDHLEEYLEAMAEVGR